MHAEQLELKDGRELRDEGVKIVMQRLDETDKATIRAAIVRAGQARIDFSSEDAVELLSDGVKEKLDAFPNALGGAMLGAARANVIESTGRTTKTRHADGRGRNIMLWRLCARTGGQHA